MFFIGCLHYTMLNTVVKSGYLAEEIPEKAGVFRGWEWVYALTAPEVMPSMYSRELNMNITISGTVAMVKPAIIAP